MHCPRCHEELLPEASLCRFCGAYVTQPERPATGATTKLPSLRTCPKCAAVMEAGYSVPATHAPGWWWVDGVWDTDYPAYDPERRATKKYPITLYRCTQCGFLEAYARSEGAIP
jgi:hypothetical protein